MNEKDWQSAVALRGRSFARNLDTYKLLTRLQVPKEKDNLSSGGGCAVAAPTLQGANSTWQ